MARRRCGYIGGRRLQSLILTLAYQQATTPLDPRVLDAMLPYWTDQYGNPHSRTHFFGWEADEAIELARKQASLLSLHCSHAVFKHC